MCETANNNGPLVAYFGYGSLVNLDTLRTDYVSAHPACLKGWRRRFQKRGRTNELVAEKGSDFAYEVDPALLSVYRDENCSIDGMIIVDQLKNLPAVDAREKLYERVKISPKDFESFGSETFTAEWGDQDIYVYRGLPPQPSASPEPVLLQSYMDAVLMGYFTRHGSQGVERFIATTDGLKSAMIADRNAPLYPRSVAIEKSMQEWFGKLLQDAGVTIQNS